MVACQPTLAHSFFSYSCCHDQDCSGAWDGEVVVTPNGYLVRGKARSELVPFGDPRIKHVPADEEQRYYLCRNAGDPGGYLLCIYVPEFGS